MKAGWQESSVIEFADCALGKMLDKRKNRGTPRPYLRNLNVRWFGFELSDLLEMNFEEGEIARYSVRKGDLVICEGGYPGRAAIWDLDETVLYQKALHRVRCHDPRRNKWLLYYLHKLDLAGELKNHFTGSGIQHFTGRSLSQLKVPLPPLEEQERIVAVLDEAFEGLARARAHAEANLQNARELFENSLEAELAALGGGNQVRLGDHIDLLAGYAFKSSGYTEDRDAMRLMRGDNVVPGAIRWDGAKYWPLDGCGDYERFQLLPDDVVIAMDRTWINAGIKYAVLTVDDVPSLLVQRVARLRCLLSLNTHFLSLLIGSNSFEQYVLSIQTGTGVPHISPAQISNFTFPLPDITTQEQIVRRLQRVRGGCDYLAQIYSVKLRELDDLRQSLLQKAFAGELT